MGLALHAHAQEGKKPAAVFPKRQGHPARENIGIKGWYFSEQ